MDRLQQIEDKRVELLRRMNENIVKIEELQAENRDLSRAILSLEYEKEELDRKETIENFKKLAAEKFPKGYTIYKVVLETDYFGSDSVDIIVWDNNIDIVKLDEILDNDARENAKYYGYTLEEELPILCEEYGYDDEEELIDNLGLEISGYHYWYERIKLDDLDKYEIQDLIDRFL